LVAIKQKQFENENVRLEEIKELKSMVVDLQNHINQIADGNPAEKAKGMTIFKTRLISLINEEKTIWQSRMLPFFNISDLSKLQLVNTEWHKIFGSRQTTLNVLAYSGVTVKSRFLFWRSKVLYIYILFIHIIFICIYIYIYVYIYNCLKKFICLLYIYIPMVAKINITQVPMSIVAKTDTPALSNLSHTKMDEELATDIAAVTSEYSLISDVQGEDCKTYLIKKAGMLLPSILKYIAERSVDDSTPLGFCQGINYLAFFCLKTYFQAQFGDDGNVKITTDAEDSVGALPLVSTQMCYILDSNGLNLQSLYASDLSGLCKVMDNLATFINKHIPTLDEHLQKLNLTPYYFASPWYLTAFANMKTLKPLMVVRIWDWFMMEGITVRDKLLYIHLYIYR
jgi:hypothetical protein